MIWAKGDPFVVDLAVGPVAQRVAKPRQELSARCWGNTPLAAVLWRPWLQPKDSATLFT